MLPLIRAGRLHSKPNSISSTLRARQVTASTSRALFDHTRHRATAAEPTSSEPRGLATTRPLSTRSTLISLPSSLPASRRTLASLVDASSTSRPPPVVLPPVPMTDSPFPPCPPIPQAAGPVDLILPPTEDRPHKYFTLPNGMEVIVVSDPKADKAAASMDVGVGHLSDPDDLPGCAHFCEHLLFMGTKTYPAENEYSSFLSKNNGGSNAWTAMTSTNYYFDVAPEALEGALERFSGFFIEPLFNDSCTEREIKAVDSEHKKNIQNDMWRFFQLEKSISRPGHPYGKFGTGDYKTLWDRPKEAGRDPRQQLISWWEKEYCARRMKLAVVGKHDVDTLEKWVREKFDKVPVRTEGRPPVGTNGVRIVFEDTPYGPEQQGLVTFVKPVRENRGLEITFPFPDLDHMYQSKPGNFLSHFLGHEGRGSILSYLKKQGWVNTLRAGMSHGAAGFDFFKVTVDLTPEGLEHWSDVAMSVFQYISLLRSQPPSKSAFDEIKAIADISFKFAERGSTSRYCTGLSGWMQTPVPREKIISSNWLVEEYREDELRAALSLLDPRKALLGVTCRDLPENVEGTFDKKESIYGTEYKQQRLPEDFIKQAMSGVRIDSLHLPGPNLFIPEKLDVAKTTVEHPALRPALLRDSAISRLWHKQDDRFWLPKTQCDISLHSPLLDVTPRNHVLSKLFADLYNDHITEDVYDASLAELSFTMWHSGDSINIFSGGFSDKLAVLTETMLQKMVDFKVDPERFDKITDSMRMDWKNFNLSEPYIMSHWWSSYAGSAPMWSHAERLAELEFIKPADVEQFAKDVLARLHIETLIHGNTSSQGAQEIQDMLERVLHPRPLSEAEKAARRSLLLPEASEHVLSLPVPNEAEVNSAVCYGVHVGDAADQKLRATLQLFEQIVKEPAFDQLRTKEQLGYIVFTSSMNGPGVMGFRVIVQSERDPVYVETRIEAFFDWVKDHLEKMSAEDFEEHKRSLIAKKEEKPKNLSEESKRFWSRISDRYYEFGKRETDVANLRNTTKADLIELFDKHIHASSPVRRKLSTHLKSQYKGVKFDQAALAPLIAAFTKHAITVDQSALQGVLASKPSLETIKTFATAAVEKTANLAAEAKAELEHMIAELKGSSSEQDAEVKLRDGNVWIDNLQKFKDGLIPSKAPLPIEPFKMDAKL